MLTIGVELNHVVRNINKQILKCYAKEFDPSMDWDELDDHVDVFDNYCKFKSKYEKNNFLYVDYPFEIFGSANTAEKKLAVKITNWLSEITNIEDEDIRIIFYSLDEDALTIQSSFFFLSKIGARVRKVIFPKKLEEVWDECDVVITARNEFFEKEIPEGKKAVLINRDFNKENKEKAFLNYDNLSDVINDNEFFNKVGKNE
jgi:phenylpyruvate tautomerase PptA (4-oxalocrotonate tautomerase family)